MQHPLNTENLNVQGPQDALVLVVCDVPGVRTFEEGLAMPVPSMNMFGSYGEAFGLRAKDFVFITPCPPIPDTVSGSDKREREFFKTYHEELLQLVAQFPNIQLTVTLGPLPSKQVLNRAVKITKIRGQVVSEPGWPTPILPLLSPGHVFRRPELQEQFESDFKVIKTLSDNEWNPTVLEELVLKSDYHYTYNLDEWLENPPKAICVDTEYKGGHWYSPTFDILCVQLTKKSGQSVVIPLNKEWFDKEELELPSLTPDLREQLIYDLNELLSNPNVACTGSNLGGDILGLKKMGVNIANWKHDTMQLAFVVDENMLEKGLSDVTRRFVPALAGYDDEFNRTVDKEHMEDVLPSYMLPYAGGDTDAGYRATRTLVKRGMEDPRNWNCYERVQMPALRMFSKMTERGIRIDKDALRELGVVLREDIEERYNALISQVAPSIKEKHADVGLSFSRANFVVDILFEHPDGLKLEPVVYTKGTKKLEGKDRKPSVSMKDHLPYFEQIDFVKDLMEYQKVSHMLSKYVGQEGGVLIPSKRKTAKPRYTKSTGFWQYLEHGDHIHPSFFLHRTVTGRTASASPNAQNFPKRGKLAKAFRKIFIPEDGYKFIEIDLSQAELRIAAWMAQEQTMLRIYREGGDIHEATAAAVMGVNLEEFKTWKGSAQPLSGALLVGARDCDTLGELYDLKRYQAKAINFGFLFGMGWKKFMAYAKTEYGLNFNEQEAKAMRYAFFDLYPGLKTWHNKVREFVKQHGYVRSLHGALRRLTNVWSSDEAIQDEAKRQGINSPVQRFASDIALMGLTRFGRDTDWDIFPALAFIHDAGIIQVKDGYEEEGMSAAKFYFENTPLFEWFGLNPPIPIVADIKISEGSLGEMVERPDILANAPSWYREELDAI